MEFILYCKCLLYVHYTVYPIYINTMEEFLYCRFDNYLKFNAADYIIFEANDFKKDSKQHYKSSFVVLILMGYIVFKPQINLSTLLAQSTESVLSEHTYRSCKL